MTGTAAACRWIASAICLGNAGRGLIAATSARQFCPLIRRWRLRCWQKGQGRISRLARYAAEPWLLMDGKPIVRRPVQRRHTADSSGNICEKSGADVLTIRTPQTRLWQGFLRPFSAGGVCFYVRPCFREMLSTF